MAELPSKNGLVLDSPTGLPSATGRCPSGVSTGQVWIGQIAARHSDVRTRTTDTS